MSSSNSSPRPGSGNQPSTGQTWEDAPEWLIDENDDDSDRDFAPPADFFDIEEDDEEEWEDDGESDNMGKPL